MKCYYCGCETVKEITLITFYTKKCKNCRAVYYLDYNNNVTQINIKTIISDKTYLVTHVIARNIVAIRKVRDEWEWDSSKSSAKVLPIDIIEFDGDFNTITPLNIHEKLKTILTFL